MQIHAHILVLVLQKWHQSYVFLQFAFLILQCSWNWPAFSWVVRVGLGEEVKGRHEFPGGGGRD